MKNSDKTYYPNLLLVTGSGRNVGKTTLSTGLIKKFANVYPVVGIKISPHFHDVNYKISVEKVTDKYSIYEETNSSQLKDSSIMKAAGATPVFYIQSKEEYIYQAFQNAIQHIKGNYMIICESGGLHKYLKAGLLLYLKSESGTEKGRPIESIEIIKDDNFFLESINMVHVENYTWNYLNEYEII